MGSLEADVLDVLWREAEPMTPAMVNDRLGGDLAYTTVMTILVRLWKKGLLDRTKVGRGYAYLPCVSEPELGAAKMRSALEATTDRTLTMSRFVDQLSSKERTALRSALEDLDQ